MPAAKVGGKDTDLPIGLIRKALLKSPRGNINEHIQSIGTHDPSGHLIVVSPSNRKKINEHAHTLTIGGNK